MKKPPTEFSHWSDETPTPPDSGSSDDDAALCPEVAPAQPTRRYAKHLFTAGMIIAFITGLALLFAGIVVCGTFNCAGYGPGKCVFEFTSDCAPSYADFFAAAESYGHENRTAHSLAVVMTMAYDAAIGAATNDARRACRGGSLHIIDVDAAVRERLPRLVEELAAVLNVESMSPDDTLMMFAPIYSTALGLACPADE